MRYETPNFKDKVLTCCECGNNFVWTAGEQRFYYSKGLAEPRRCPECRNLRKATLPHDALARVRSVYGDDDQEQMRGSRTW